MSDIHIEARIIAAYQRGQTVQEIADSEGRTFDVVRGVLRRNSVQMRSRARRAGITSGARPGGSR